MLEKLCTSPPDPSTHTLDQNMSPGGFWNPDFIFLGSKITVDGDCSHEIKRHMFLGRKAMTNLDSMLKSRDYFVNKGQSSQGYGFSNGHVWM